METAITMIQFAVYGGDTVLRGYLVAESEGWGSRQLEIGSSLVVGRAADCGLVIEDGAASRRHLEITTRQGGYYWRDLGSTNGTLLNNRRASDGRLEPGDVLRIGDTTLRLEVREVSEAPVQEAATMLATMRDWQGEESGAGPVRDKTSDLLRAVYSVMNEVATNYEPCALVDKILQTTMRAVDAQRGAIVFAGKTAQELGPCPVCHFIHMIREGELYRGQREELRISNTVAQRVLSGGESLLYRDTDDHGDLNDAASIMALNLRSIICVPLRGKNGILGILYMDSNRPDQQYTQDDLLLSTAVGNSAGLAIENAHLHNQILEKQRMDQELQYAWSIQEGFLVREWPDHANHFEMYGETRPAKVIGGDFYDFVQPLPDHVGILIGDVSGKGIPAALTMAQLLAEFRLCARGTASPVEVLKALNADLVKRSRHGMFCSLCYLILDLQTGTAHCANAGHHPAVFLTKKGSRLYGGASGPPAGVLPYTAWKDVKSVLDPGDTVLLYTDGIIEARSQDFPQGGAEGYDEYGAERLLALAEGFYARPPRELIEAVNVDVLHHCGPVSPHDDCTMIAVRYLG